jgi:hypothetical protein
MPSSPVMNNRKRTFENRLRRRFFDLLPGAFQLSRHLILLLDCNILETSKLVGEASELLTGTVTVTRDSATRGWFYFCDTLSLFPKMRVFYKN